MSNNDADDLNRDIAYMVKFPESKDELFATDSDWWNNACLNCYWDKWSMYADGYKDAANILVERIEKRKKNVYQDTLVYPIIYLYRQYLELAFKGMIKDLRKLNDIDIKVPTHHKIDTLWGDCKKMLNEIAPGDSINELDQVTRLVRIFCKVDPNSESFRYPYNREGGNPIEGITHINLRVLRLTMHKISNLLAGAQGMISQYLEYKTDMNHDNGYY